jgi:hypothetical protein
VRVRDTSGTGGDVPVQPSGGEDPAVPGGPDGTPAETPLDPQRPFGAWLGGTAIQRTKQALRRGLLVSCRSEVAVWCALTVTVSAKDAKKLKLGRKTTRVATSALPVPAGKSARARLKLTKKARRALRGKTGVRLLVRAVARTADGRQVVLTRVVLVRR